MSINKFPASRHLFCVLLRLILSADSSSGTHPPLGHWGFSPLLLGEGPSRGEQRYMGGRAKEGPAHVLPINQLWLDLVTSSCPRVGVGGNYNVIAVQRTVDKGSCSFPLPWFCPKWFLFFLTYRFFTVCQKLKYPPHMEGQPQKRLKLSWAQRFHRRNWPRRLFHFGEATRTTSFLKAFACPRVPHQGHACNIVCAYAKGASRHNAEWEREEIFERSSVFQLRLSRMCANDIVWTALAYAHTVLINEGRLKRQHKTFCVKAIAMGR